MFLDDFGNPKEVTPETLSTYTYDLHGTKLLTSADTEIYLPPMWHGTIYSTERLLDTYKRRFNPDPTLLTFHAMQPYEPEFICVQRAVVELTLLPAGQSLYSDKDIVVFLIKQPAEMKNSLATKELSTLLDFFPHNHHYHSIIMEEGIDVVYVDDKIYNNISPTSHQFHRLFNLLGNIQPGDVRSLSGTPLPAVLRNACRRTAHKTK